ncbi:gluconate 2-dehydrogenase subunit 3 family protein [Virgibacillus sp. FSP13]
MLVDKHSDNNKEGHDPSRRRFIKNTGMVAGGVVGGSLLGGFLTDQFISKPETQTGSDKQNQTNFQEARQFFTRLEDFHVLAAATERIFPKDKNGPGAIELGVPYYIDKQMAGQWGRNARDYRHAPFLKFKQVESMKGKEEEKHPTNPPFLVNKPETELQRHQSRLTRGEIFIEGLRKLNMESKKRFEKTFDKAEKDQQIELLQDMESGKIQLVGVAGENFFTLLRRMTLEGAYCDPLYGGNKNMDGWKMKEFPGAQASYANIIEKEDFVKIKPISLTNYQGH